MAINLIIVAYFVLSIVHIGVSNVYVLDNSGNLIQSFSDQEANFGPSFTAEGLKGYVTTTDPENGCKSIAPPPVIPALHYPWIALIPRTKGNDSCEFALKARNAQNANFSAIIIYNYDDTIFTMGSSSLDIHIPSTLVAHTSGLTLIKHYLYNRTVTNNTPKFHLRIVAHKVPMTAYIVASSIIISVLFLGVVGHLAVKICTRQNRTHPNHLPRSALKQFKTKKFVKGDPWEVCAVCLDDFEVGVKLRILPCDHAYHMKCIDPWLIDTQRQCPVCKRYVFPNHDSSNGGSRAAHSPAASPTEQTPLVHLNDSSQTTLSLGDQQSPESRVIPSRSIARCISSGSEESLDSLEDLSVNNRVISSTQNSTIRIDLGVPPLNSRQYGTVQDSSRTARVPNVFVDSSDDPTNTTTAFTRCVLENISDTEFTNDDTDEQVHPTTAYSEENPAFVDDDESTTNTFHTHL